jgi:hypothetical protein
MTIAPTPVTINDNQNLPLTLALTGNNPNAVTIVSATFTAGSAVTIPVNADNVSATVVTAGAGSDGVVTIEAVATLSDGSVLTASLSVTVVSAGTGSALALQIVPGTPVDQ